MNGIIKFVVKQLKSENWLEISAARSKHNGVYKRNGEIADIFFKGKSETS